jgi:hypothetical protein
MALARALPGVSINPVPMSSAASGAGLALLAARHTYSAAGSAGGPTAAAWSWERGIHGATHTIPEV